MIETFVDSKIDLTTSGNLSFKGFMQLNESSGDSVMEGHLTKLGHSNKGFPSYTPVDPAKFSIQTKV